MKSQSRLEVWNNSRVFLRPEQRKKTLMDFWSGSSSTRLEAQILVPVEAPQPYFRTSQVPFWSKSFSKFETSDDTRYSNFNRLVEKKLTGVTLFSRYRRSCIWSRRVRKLDKMCQQKYEVRERRKNRRSRWFPELKDHRYVKKLSPLQGRW